MSMRDRSLAFAFFAAAILCSMVREWSAPAQCARAALVPHDGVPHPSFAFCAKEGGDFDSHSVILNNRGDSHGVCSSTENSLVRAPSAVHH